MKKTMVTALFILLAISFVSCAKQTAPKAGEASGESMLRLLPRDLSGVFLVDVGRAMSSPAAERALKDEETQKKYQEFVQEMGIDPMRDVHYLAAGIGGEMWSQDQQGAVVVNLRYDRETLLAKLRENGGDIVEDVYSGITIYKGAQDDEAPGPKTCGAFLDDSNIVLGTEPTVRAVIDVFQKRTEPVTKNEEMNRLLATVDKSALAWGAFAIPSDAVKKMAEGNPSLSVLEGVSGLVMAFDYKNRSVVIDLRTSGGTDDNNKNLADMLNGLKAMGNMAAAQEPVVGDLLNAIAITSGSDFVKLHIDIPEEVMDKLQEAAKTKIPGIVPQIEK